MLVFPILASIHYILFLVKATLFYTNHAFYQTTIHNTPRSPLVSRSSSDKEYMARLRSSSNAGSSYLSPAAAEFNGPPLSAPVNDTDGQNDILSGWGVNPAEFASSFPESSSNVFVDPRDTVFRVEDYDDFRLSMDAYTSPTGEQYLEHQHYRYNSFGSSSDLPEDMGTTDASTMATERSNTSLFGHYVPGGHMSAITPAGSPLQPTNMESGLSSAFDQLQFSPDSSFFGMGAGVDSSHVSPQLNKAPVSLSMSQPNYSSVINRSSLPHHNTVLSEDVPMTRTFSTESQRSRERLRLRMGEVIEAQNKPIIPKPVKTSGQDPATPARKTPKRAKNKEQCDICGDILSGKHEVDRHRRSHDEFQDAYIISDDHTDDKLFIGECHACRGDHKYKAEYNAAAHLRRIHYQTTAAKKDGKKGGVAAGDDPHIDVCRQYIRKIRVHKSEFKARKRTNKSNSADIDAEEHAQVMAKLEDEEEKDIDEEDSDFGDNQLGFGSIINNAVSSTQTFDQYQFEQMMSTSLPTTHPVAGSGPVNLGIAQRHALYGGHSSEASFYEHGIEGANAYIGAFSGYAGGETRDNTDIMMMSYTGP
jgi:hypothetical protein